MHCFSCVRAVSRMQNRICDKSAMRSREPVRRWITAVATTAKACSRLLVAVAGGRSARNAPSTDAGLVRLRRRGHVCPTRWRHQRHLARVCGPPARRRWTSQQIQAEGAASKSVASKKLWTIFIFLDQSFELVKCFFWIKSLHIYF